MDRSKSSGRGNSTCCGIGRIKVGAVRRLIWLFDKSTSSKACFTARHATAVAAQPLRCLVARCIYDVMLDSTRRFEILGTWLSDLCPKLRGNTVYEIVRVPLKAYFIIFIKWLLVKCLELLRTHPR